MFESRTRWSDRVMRISVGERPHPAIRGYMSIIQEERGERVKVWVDASVKEDGRKAYAWVVAANGVIENGARRVNAEMNILELEGWAVWQGIKEELNCRGQIGIIIVFTDSEQTVRQIEKYENRWWAIDEIQREIARGLEKEILIRVEHRSRRADEIRTADRECRWVMREDGEGERVNGVSKSYARKWRREWEMGKWQRLWDGVMGRWLHVMWGRVNRIGANVSSKLTQVATGHGDFRGYLRKFGLDEGLGGGCECGAVNESVEHVVL